jgi:hypothetical protein
MLHNTQDSASLTGDWRTKNIAKYYEERGLCAE